MHHHLNDWDEDLLTPWSTTRTVESHPYRDWLKAVFCWDGILPFFIISVATLIPLVFPKQDTVQLVANVLIPIAAFFWRAAMAGRHFEQGRQFSWQVLLFFLGIFFLVLLDAIFIVCHMNPKQLTPEDWRVMGIMYLIYFGIMAISLFPFRANTAENAVELERNV